MKTIVLVALVMMSSISFAHSQEHVHGQGSVFIVQGGNDWQVQFTVPASDALGFEHAPENAAQEVIFSKLKQSLQQFNGLMQFSPQCDQSSTSNNLASFQSDKHGNGHKHEHSNHADIEITYVIKCEDTVESISFSVFDKMHSLEKLEVQWSIQSGQGFSMITKGNTQLNLI